MNVGLIKRVFIRALGKILRILGLDPGSLKTGFGVIDYSRGTYRYVTSGIIKIPSTLSLPERLGVIAKGVDEIICGHQPECCAIEDVFFARNAKSALKLGQARGAAITACVGHDLNVSEYAPRLVKQAVTGTGAAAKDQIQFMIKRILKLEGVPKEDAADALAVAVCHAHFDGKNLGMSPNEAAMRMAQ